MHNEELREKIIVAIHSYEREIKQELPLSDSEYGDLADRILALMPPVGEKGLREAFLAGAKWWEFHTTDATMWQSDQADTWKEAEKRYGPGERSDPIAALRPAAPQVVECPTCKSQDVNCSDPWHIDHSPAQQPEVVLSPLDRSRMVEAVTQMPEDDELAQQPEAGAEPRPYSDEEKVLCQFISDTPSLLSLLYDIDLLPEQTHGKRDFGRTMMIAAYWRQQFPPAPEAPAAQKRWRCKGCGKIVERWQIDNLCENHMIGHEGSFRVCGPVVEEVEEKDGK